MARKKKSKRKAPRRSKRSVDDAEIEELVIVPVRNMILFPGVVLPLMLGRESSVLAVRAAVEDLRSRLPASTSASGSSSTRSKAQAAGGVLMPHHRTLANLRKKFGSGFGEMAADKRLSGTQRFADGLERWNWLVWRKFRASDWSHQGDLLKILKRDRNAERNPCSHP